ncbi:MAG: hypothetical protein EPO12_00195 [Aquabacterium sp.]|nr:MAG: hypothetical protein EPO12_00195 [Aquabacterium sp.]
MNLFTGTESADLFGGEVPDSVRHLIEVARNAPLQQVQAALWTAAVSAPDCLPVYYLLYKLHARLGEFDRALQAASTGLDAAARAAGLPQDWRAVQPGAADFGRPGAARFWLFTLKALAFIGLRRGDRDGVAELVAQLRRLDPQDQLGASVVETLLRESASGPAPA